MATPDPARFTWDAEERKFRDKFGRFVSRRDVRLSLDRMIDNVTVSMKADTESLVAGSMEIGTWQGRMEANIKKAHTAATAIAKGGWKQASSSDWAMAGRQIKEQYKYLDRFARQLENGRPMNGQTINRAEMYGLSATRTYEGILRRDDLLEGFDLEMRVLHSQTPCDQCAYYADLGWVVAGTLPGIGEECECLTRCRCTFERKRSKESKERRKAMNPHLGWFANFLNINLAKSPGGKKTSNKKKSRQKEKKAGVRRQKASGKANVGCGTGAGGFAKGNSCRKGGGGGASSKDGEAGPITQKARKDAKEVGVKADVIVEKGPPRNAREERLLAKAQKEGKDAIVRVVTYKAWTSKEGSQTTYYHGSDSVARVMPTKDIGVHKPGINGKPYDPKNFKNVQGKFTVVTDIGIRGSLITSHPTQAKADKVARSRVKDERNRYDDEREYKLVKDHTKSNLVVGTDWGGDPKARMTIRVLRPKSKAKSSGEAMSSKLDAYDSEKCKRRSRIAAIRDGIEGAEVTLFPSGVTGLDAWEKGNLLHASGSLPVSSKEAMGIINLCRKSCGDSLLKKDDVYIHFMEAANGNFIPDRFMFLDATTLRNLAERGESGMAFMNSHKTGGLSSPAEHPYGRTFSGRYEELEHEGTIHKRALLGIYMLKGHYPNGRLLPSTDDFHQGIEGGTLKDVSIGLNGGLRICDVCARNLGDKDCNHTPATATGMTPEQMVSQTARGVTGGKASYTVVDGQPYEVSAVFKGAVPGAGFRKAMAQKLAAQSDKKFGLEVLSAYGSMMNEGERKLFKKGKTKMKFSDILKLAGLAQSAGVELEDLDEGDITSLKSGTMVPVSVGQASTSPGSNGFADERAQLDAERKALAMERFQLQADAYVTPLVNEGKVTGPDVEALKLCFVQAAMDDKFSPVQLSIEGSSAKLTRVEALKLANSNRTKHVLAGKNSITDTPVIPDGQKVLPQEDLNEGDDEMSEARKNELLGMSDMGVSVIPIMAK